ncbi:MAG: hypothetical protein Kow0059_17790 [Candidatus Sumerlaeia bacterium]
MFAGRAVAIVVFGVVVAAYFPLKARNPNFYLFFDPLRCWLYLKAWLAWGVIALSSIAAGAKLRRMLRLGGDECGLKSDDGLMAFLVIGLGLGAHTAGLFILAATGGLTLAVLLPLNLLIVLWGGGEVRRFFSELFRQSPSADSIRGSKRDAWPGWATPLLTGAALAALLPVALMLGAPVADWDEMVYQLTIPRRMVEAHGFVRQPYLFFFDWPLNLNLLYAECLALGTPATARFWHFGLGLLSGGLVARLARRWRAEPGVGWLAAALFLTIPVVQYEMGVALVDLGLTFFVLLAFSVWEREAASGAGCENWQAGALEIDAGDRGGAALPSPSPPPATTGTALRRAALAGVFVGLAAGVKYMGLFALGALGAVIFVHALSASPAMRRIGFKQALLFTVVACVVFLPWAVKSWIVTGNPVYPQLYGVFGGRDWSAEFDRQWRDWIFSLGRGQGLLDFILLPWRLTFESSPLYSDFAGEVGPLIFPAALAALVMPSARRRTWPALLAAFFYTVFWFWTSQQVRFLIPALALLAAAGGAALAGLLSPGGRWPGWCAAVGAVFLILSWAFNPTPLSIADANWTVTFGRPQAMSDDGYLRYRRGVDNIEAVRALNRIMGGRGAALLFFDNRGYYLERPYLADGAFEVSRIVARLMESDSPASFYEWLRDRGITHVFWNRNFSESPTGDFVSRYYPGYKERWKNFIADHGKNVYEGNNIIIYELSARPLVESMDSGGAEGREQRSEP